MFNFLGTIAEYFLDLNRERTLEGLKAPARRGRKGGRRRKLCEEDLAMARTLLKDPTIPVAQIAMRLGVSRATFYAYFPGARKRRLPNTKAAEAANGPASLEVLRIASENASMLECSGVEDDQVRAGWTT